MLWSTEFIFKAFYEITKEIIEKTTSIVQKEINTIGYKVEARIENKDSFSVINYDLKKE